MKSILKTLLATAAFTAIASTAFAESYEVDSIDGSAKINISVQGAGKTSVPNRNLPLPADGIIRQHMTLNADHTMTGMISFYSPTEGSTGLFSLSGAWYRPAGSKIIYFALDGDPTQGPASTGTYGALFDPAKAELMALPTFMPVLFGTKVTSVNPIYPSVKFKTGIIKLKLAGSQIKGASSSLVLTGRAMVQPCKMVANVCVDNGAPKDSAFGFSSTSKSTVVPGP